MSFHARWLAVLTAIAMGLFAGCTRSERSPHVSASIRTALDAVGLKTVSVTQDAAKGVVTLGGHVRAHSDKVQAEATAKSLSDGDVVADQIAVMPFGAEGDTRAINSAFDKGIEQNLEASLIHGRLHGGVSYAVKSRVVTLRGEVASQSRRRQVARLAGGVPNVQQVLNKLQVKNQKASFSE